MMLSMRASTVAREAFEKGFNCCEAILMAANEVYQLNLPPDILAGGSLFGRGMGSGGGSCGALVGLMLVSGMLAREHPHPRKKKLSTHLYSLFSKKFSASSCEEICQNRAFWAKPGEKGCASLVEATAAMMVGTWEEVLLGSKKNICDRTHAQ